MSFDNIDSINNSNSILIIVLIAISIIILIVISIVINRDWNSKSFEKEWKLKKVRFQEEMKIEKSKRV